MSFTYDIASGDDDILTLSRIRLKLGDQREDDGVLPDGRNLQDEEIAATLTANDGDTVAALADLRETIGNHWSTVADVSVGPRRESLSQVAKQWKTAADEGATGKKSIAGGYFGVASRGT